ncbi:hypothetical protein G7Y79_00001g000340 [Physcia stellaris]|nr:hypothetical protein G7Y79_00001g000340 [Physcia stellaris]
MATQYDTIAASYNEMRKLPTAKLVDHNVKVAVSPFVKGAKVLDLACGTGLYTQALHSWGASQVFGVDLSSSMIDLARATVASESVQFEVGDCSKPKIFGTGEYDLVLGAWLLNYAASKQEMTDMYRTIAMNLKDDGVFVGVAPHPSEDPEAHLQKILEVRPVGLNEVAVLPGNEVPDGIRTHLVSILQSGKVEFDAYYLKKVVYEMSAREGGLKGEMAWRPIELPKVEMEAPTSGQTREYWHTHLSAPHFGVLVISKN